MNRTGLFALIAVVIVGAAAALWYFTASNTPKEASVPSGEVATSAGTSAGAPATTEAPADADRRSTTPPADGEPAQSDDATATPAPAPEEEKDQAEPNAQALDEAAPAPAPPPPPPPPPVAAAPAPEPTQPPAKTETRSRANAPAIAGRAAQAENIPTFPWPVPRASATQAVPRKLIIGSTNTPTFGSVAERIASALDHAGYGERSYYALADGHGIAIATQLEQINDDGTPVVQARFEDGPPSPSTEQFSLTHYVKALFTARTGRFRIIVFTLSGGIAQNMRPPTEQQAKSWPGSGQIHLPQRYALIPFGEDVTCTALIYEFEKRDYASAATFVEPGKVNAMSHLVKTGIWALLDKP